MHDFQESKSKSSQWKSIMPDFLDDENEDVIENSLLARADYSTILEEAIRKFLNAGIFGRPVPLFEIGQIEPWIHQRISLIHPH